MILKGLRRKLLLSQSVIMKQKKKILVIESPFFMSVIIMTSTCSRQTATLSDRIDSRMENKNP